MALHRVDEYLPGVDDLSLDELKAWRASVGADPETGLFRTNMGNTQDNIQNMAANLGLVDHPGLSVASNVDFNDIASQIGYDDFNPQNPDSWKELENRIREIHDGSQSSSSNDSEGYYGEDYGQSYQGGGEASSEGYTNSYNQGGQTSQNRFNNNQNNNQNNNNNLRRNQYKKPNSAVSQKPAVPNAGEAAANGAKEAAKTKAAAAKEGVKEAVKNAATAAKEGLKTLSKNPKFWIAVGIVALLLLLVVLITTVIINNGSSSNELQDQVPYVQIKHNNTVKVKIDGKIEEISLDEYVAGVLYHEIAGFSDEPEVLKAFAIAARTNVQILMRYSPYADSYKSDGYLKNSNMLSYKKVGKNTKYMKAAEETTGMVLVSSIKDPKYYWAFFDAIAFKSSCGGKQTDSTVILCQKGVEIPISWLKKHGNWSTMQNQSAHASHGKGMSQWGAYYLGKEKKKTALELLDLFYSEAKVITFIPNKSTEKDDDEDKKFSIDCNNISFSTTPGYSQLTTNIKSFLSGKGTSLKSINNGLRDRVAEAGPGTRCAVVTAAKYTVESLSKYKVRMRYFWGGKHPTTYGFHKSWGSSAYAKNKYGTTYHYSGLDCGTYIQWIYKNAGINLSSGQFGSRGKHHSVGSYTGKPGDVLYKKGHVMLILKYVKSSNSYYVAEAANKKDGVRIRKAKVSNLKNSKYKIVDMSSYFNKKSATKYKSNFNSGRKD